MFGDGARNVFGDHGVAQALNTINVVEVDHSVVFDEIFNYGFDVFFFGDGGVDNDLISGLVQYHWDGFAVIHHVNFAALCGDSFK